jgi:hypothetical protein
MAITEAYSGTKAGQVSGDGEWSLSNGTTSVGAQTGDGVFQAFIDVSDQAVGEVSRIRVYEKARSGDTQRLVYDAILRDVQAEPLFVTPSLILLHGWDITFTVITGTITVYWSIRQVA